MEWDTSCVDWRERILAGQSLIPFKPLFPAEAEAAMSYMRQLRMTDVAGEPTIGERCRPWMMDFASAIFGAYDAQTGRRLIRNFFLLISKKNGKSTIAAAIMVTALLRNWRRDAEFLILAPTVEVANNSFGPARQMILADPELARLLYVQDHTRTITHRETGATLKVVAADTDTVGGKKATGVLIDELHLFGTKAGADTMLVEATGGLASRPEGFTIYLSTHSDKAPAGVFKTTLERFRRIRDGVVKDKRSLGVLYEWPEHLLKDDAYLNPKLFYVTNPNLGASVDEEFLIEKLAEESDKGEASKQAWVSKHLNVQVDVALGHGRWAGADEWEGSADPELTLESLLARSEVVTVGIDGGGLDDLLAVHLIGRDRDTKEWLAFVKCWCHRKVLERRKDIADRLEDFARDGDLTICDDVSGRISGVVATVEKAMPLLPEKAAVGLDPVGVSQIIDALSAIGITADQMAGVSQGWKLNAAIQGMPIKLADGTMKHAGRPIMSWMVGNAKAVAKGNAVAIEKATSGKAKIDGLMAAFNAFHLMSMNPEAASHGRADDYFAALRAAAA